MQSEVLYFEMLRKRNENQGLNQEKATHNKREGKKKDKKKKQNQSGKK